MVLYTPMPMETVLEGFEEISNTRQQLKEINYNGLTMIVTPDKDMFKIERVISTDPGDYLNPEYQPGCLIRL